MAETRKMPSPFKYRNGWRAQVTLSNGMRPHADFGSMAEAKDWITDTLAEDTEHEPALGGPTQATLAQALAHYAGLYTVVKGGYAAELTRINHYLEGAGMQLLRVVANAEGARELETYKSGVLPVGWQAHAEARRGKRAKTYECIHRLGKTRCSRIAPKDIRELMTMMSKEGLSDSTIQKEIALVRHMFNMAEKEWSWKGFKNPTEGIKLGKSQARFVFLTQEQQSKLWQAVAECDNPYFAPLTAAAMATTLRKNSLLSMVWDNTDLDGRVAFVPTKNGPLPMPLAKEVVDSLRQLPRHPSGRVFPMTPAAVDMAWEGIREKAGLPRLQFRDLRHLGATEYARRGLNAHQLRSVLGHKTLHMAQVYVNLAQVDVLNAIDAATATSPIVEVSLPDPDKSMKTRRSERLAMAVRAKAAARASSAIPPAATSD